MPATTGSAPSYKSAATYGGVYNLKHKYETKMDERFKKQSYTEPFCGNGYSWAGHNAISIFTLGSGKINDYDFTAQLGSRLGTMHEINDEVNTYQLKKYRSIRETFEQVYNMDQGNIRKEQAIIKDLIDNKLKPEIDTYRLETWAKGAGQTKILSSALSKSNIVESLLLCNAMLDNADVPEEGRVCFMSISDAVMVNLADELKYQQMYTEKGAVRGEVSMLGRTKIVQVPDKLMPTGCKALFKWKGATADPRVLDWLKVYPNVEGYSGPVMNGIYRYDSFVLAQKADGILILGDTNVKPLDISSMTLAITAATGVVTASNAPAGATLKCTVDGRNPKIADNGNVITLVSGTSTIAASGTPTLLVPDGGIVRIYAEKANSMNSAIVNFKYDATNKTLTKVTDFDI